MGWVKRGIVLKAPIGLAWAASHAAVPLAVRIDGSRHRLYFTARDAEGRSHTGRADLSLSDRSTQVDPSPVLKPGATGTFDDSGAMATWLVRLDDAWLLYYIGWNRGVSVPFRNALGLAISQNGGESFEKLPGPILDRSVIDPYFVSCACVLRDAGIWRMWYLSCTGWSMVDGAPRHHYLIKYAESNDAIAWKPTGRVCIGFANEGEYAISQPCVIRDRDCYRMWYSFRGDRYRIGYAESNDGLSWIRRDDLGLQSSPAGWDSEMVEYPFVFDDRVGRFMLYNGNRYGGTGIGLAEWRATEGDPSDA